MTRKNTFKPGDLAVYFEIDSKVDTNKPEFAFLASKHGKIKTQKYTFGGKGNFVSQGLLMSFADFSSLDTSNWKLGTFLTNQLGVTYADAADNKRKAKSNPDAKYQRMMNRYPKLAKSKFGRWCMKHKWAKKLLFAILGSKLDKRADWPTGKFPGVSKTDQERCENMTWVLEDKTPYIVTQKCDGSSGTYILERLGRNKFEFYVCSRNVRMMTPNQECFYGSHNYYWEIAIKYSIEEKMRDYLNKHPELTFICWQGEICAPDIQKNPHGLLDTRFYCFHWTDDEGRKDIRDAKKLWSSYAMEVVPIVDENYILPDDFEEFKLSAEGLYDRSVCGDDTPRPREGYVYYKTTDPTFSFKNVSREYLLNH